MRLFYINGKNVMGRDCNIKLKECPVVDYMRSQAFDIKTGKTNKIQSVLFETPFHISEWERGMYVISMVSVCDECQSKKQNLAEKANQKSK